MMYQLLISTDSNLNNTVSRIDSNGNREASFLFGCGNQDDVEYQAWLAEGNQPEIVNIDEPPDVPTIDERVEAAELMVDLILDTQQENA